MKERGGWDGISEGERGRGGEGISEGERGGEGRV